MKLSDLPGSQRILLPVRASTIFASLAMALIANFLPWPNVALAPDFVALVLAFWCVQQPRLVGLGAGWVLGLFIDAGNGVLMGQHALAYSLLAFAAVTFSRRILWFSLWGQALHIAALLLVVQGVVAIVRIAAGAEFPGWTIVIAPLVGAALWPPLSTLLLIPQRRPAEAEETGAI
jgi:rod shape-determining protein MreD